MRASVLAIAALVLILLGAPAARAQGYPYYGPFFDFQYQQYLQYQNDLQWQQYLRYLQEVDPYYELHVMHYQLYLQRYQPYPAYLPCCYGFAVPAWSTASGRVRQAPATSPRQAIRRK
jgi:hypothetical protein